MSPEGNTAHDLRLRQASAVNPHHVAAVRGQSVSPVAGGAVEGVIHAGARDCLLDDAGRPDVGAVEGRAACRQLDFRGVPANPSRPSDQPQPQQCESQHQPQTRISCAGANRRSSETPGPPSTARSECTATNNAALSICSRCQHVWAGAARLVSKRGSFAGTYVPG